MQTAICGQAGAKRTWLEAFDGKSNLPGVAAFEDSLEKEFVRLMDFTREVRRTPLRCRQLKDILQQAEMPKLHFLALDCSWDAMDILSKFNFQDHDIDVIYLEVTRSKCRFLTRWTHPFRSWSWSCEKIFEKPLKDLLASNSYILVDTILVDIGGLPSLALKQFFFHYDSTERKGLTDGSTKSRRWQGMRLSPRTSVPRMGRTLKSVSCLPTMARSRSWPRKKTRAASGKTFGIFKCFGFATLPS